MSQNHDGHSCGCGERNAELDVIDVRALPHAHRHAMVLAAVGGLRSGAALVLVAPHAPLPMLAEIDRRLPGQIETEWLQEGPDVWQLRLHRVAA
jgi:uncharacterized protein (DUF2249 family)